MTIEDLIVYGKKYLPSIEAKMLLMPVTGYDTLNLLNHLNETISEENVERYKKLIEARLSNKPAQYILGNTVFYGIELNVNENVLIPRFETEELVENTLKLIYRTFGNKLAEGIKILDLCCGSGAIGIALKKNLDTSSVTMSDISRKALDVAESNLKKTNTSARLIESDLFSNIQGKFDCIVSNPPYIKDDEEIDDIVKNNEPHLALYGGKDGLDFYRRIIKDIKKHLESKFIIAFEIGCTQKDDIESIIKEYLDNIEIESKKDLSGRDRMIFIISK